MFKEPFKQYVCEGDTISCDVDGFHCVARLYIDDCRDAPDERQDGFWPSLDPKDPGYIGANPVKPFHRQQAEAEDIMRAWKNDEWHYYGVAVRIFKNDIPLTGEFEHALWGVEGNYPGGDNAYLMDCANENLPGALAAAKAKLKELCV